jgi:hypothetical protein
MESGGDHTFIAGDFTGAPATWKGILSRVNGDNPEPFVMYGDVVATGNIKANNTTYPVCAVNASALEFPGDGQDHEMVRCAVVVGATQVPCQVSCIATSYVNVFDVTAHDFGSTLYVQYPNGSMVWLADKGGRGMTSFTHIAGFTATVSGTYTFILYGRGNSTWGPAVHNAGVRAEAYFV